MKSSLYACNLNTQTVSVGGIVNFGNAVRRTGCNVNISGGNVLVGGAGGNGIYDVDTNITLLGTSAGSVTVSLYKDGTLIPGATATTTLASGDYAAVSIPCTVKQYCCGVSTITAVLTGTACSVVNSAIEVVK